MTALTLKTLLAQADKLQSFATDSKRKLPRTKALDQAAQLNGHANYQTALAVIENAENNMQATPAMIAASGTMKPWEEGRGFKDATYTIEKYNESISIKLAKVGDMDQTLEVMLELDVDQPRLIVYRPEVCSDPIFSVHSTKGGLVLQYMNDDNQMYHRNRAPADLTAQIDLVAHSTSAWIVPDLV